MFCWELFSSVSTICIAFATFVVAWRQYCISKKQKQISLYKERYYNIYVPLLDAIAKAKDTFYLRANLETLQKDMKIFLTKLDYGKFLIKKSDFNELVAVYNSIIKELTSFYGKYNPVAERMIEKKQRANYLKNRVQELQKVDNKIDLKYKKILQILEPYLQIEKEFFICKCFLYISNKMHFVLDNMAFKKKRDAL